MPNPQLTSRVAPEFVARVDALVENLNAREEHRARPLTQNDVVRLALGIGVDVMERDVRPRASPAPAKRAKKGASK